MPERHRTISPSKSGRFYGTVTPSLIGYYLDDKGRKIPANRAERRRHEKEKAHEHKGKKTDTEGKDLRTGGGDGKENTREEG